MVMHIGLSTQSLHWRICHFTICHDML